LSIFLIGIIGTIIVFVLIFLGMPIAIAFITIGFFGIWMIRGLSAAIFCIRTLPYSSVNFYSWTVIPLFVLMGYFALHSGLAAEFYSGIRRWIGHFRGGLASAVIVGNTAFGACTGAPISSAVTFTEMSLPEMRKYKYDDKMTLGAIAAGSVLAGLIPPSMFFIIYGSLTTISIGRLFIAGIFPGLILTALYVATIYIQCVRNPQMGPPGPKTTLKEKLHAGLGMWSFLAVFFVIIGGIYFGVYTPTEAGAAGTLTVLILGLARKRLSWQGFKSSMLESGITVGLVGFLLMGGLFFNVFLTITQVPATVASIISTLAQTPMATIWLIIGILFVLGMFIDGLPLTMIMIPILYPIVKSMGFDGVHFGVISILIIQIGALTPPFGILVYAVAGTAKDVPLFDIFRGAIPFIIAMFVCLTLVIFIPQISTFLPSTMFPPIA